MIARLWGAAAVPAAALALTTLLVGCQNSGPGTPAETGDGRAGAGEQAGASPTRSAASAPSSVPSAPDVPGSVKTRAAELPQVAPAEAGPSRLVVPAAGLDLPINAVGIAKDGQMALPPDPKTIGWYKFGPAPADPRGSVVLGGHLDSREFGVGPLIRLRKLRPGDTVELRSAGSRSVRYRVEAVRDVPKQQLAVDDLFDRDGARRLRIVTCGGPYDAANGGYRDNLVVTAVAAP